MTYSFVPLCAAHSSADDLARASAPSVTRLAARLAELAWAQWSDQPAYTLCAADFGWGQTFLALLRTWRARTARPQKWHMVAVAERPWSLDALRTILQAARDAGAPQDVAALLSQWPHLLPGQHRLVFQDGAVTLTLLFGPARQVLDRARFGAHGFLGVDIARLGALSRHARPDAWWLFEECPEPLQQALRQVGFVVDDARSPSLQSSAWQRDAGQPGSGQPGSGQPGDGQPGDGQPGDGQSDHGRSVGGASQHGPLPPVRLARRRAGLAARSTWREPVAGATRTAVVVGAGMAGASVASALARRGWSVQLVGSPVTHRGHVAAALTPVLARDDNARARLTRAGALRASAIWPGLGPDLARCTGTLQLDRPDGRGADLEHMLDRLQFPPGWVRAVDRQQASALAGIPVSRAGIYFSGGMLVRPDRLIAALTATPGVTLIEAAVHRIASSAGGWQAMGAKGEVLAEAGQVVIAAAHASVAILNASGMLGDFPQLASMHRLAGEITLLPACEVGGGPACVIGGEGYVLPAVDGQVAIGSTYVHGASHSGLSGQGQTVNIEKMRNLLNLNGGEATGLSADSLRYPGWAGWRGVVQGRLPVIGELGPYSGVWVATAYASRGLTWSALAADMIAGALEGEPDVLECDLASAIAAR